MDFVIPLIKDKEITKAFSELDSKVRMNVFLNTDIFIDKVLSAKEIEALDKTTYK